MLSPDAAAPRAHLAVRKQTAHSSPKEGRLFKGALRDVAEDSGKAVRTVQWYPGADRGGEQLGRRTPRAGGALQELDSS